MTDPTKGRTTMAIECNHPTFTFRSSPHDFRVGQIVGTKINRWTVLKRDVSDKHCPMYYLSCHRTGYEMWINNPTEFIPHTH